MISAVLLHPGPSGTRSRPLDAKVGGMGRRSPLGPSRCRHATQQRTPAQSSDDAAPPAALVLLPQPPHPPLVAVHTPRRHPPRTLRLTEPSWVRAWRHGPAGGGSWRASAWHCLPRGRRWNGACTGSRSAPGVRPLIPPSSPAWARDQAPPGRGGARVDTPGRPTLLHSERVLRGTAAPSTRAIDSWLLGLEKPGSRLVPGSGRLESSGLDPRVTGRVVTGRALSHIIIAKHALRGTASPVARPAPAPVVVGSGPPARRRQPALQHCR
jgi:hypothetical protein